MRRYKRGDIIRVKELDCPCGYEIDGGIDDLPLTVGKTYKVVETDYRDPDWGEWDHLFNEPEDMPEDMEYAVRLRDDNKCNETWLHVDHIELAKKTNKERIQERLACLDSK